jgi:hypothetical protein
MQVVGEPDARPPVQADMNAVLVKHGDKPAASLERHAFHAAAETACAMQRQPAAGAASTGTTAPGRRPAAGRPPRRSGSTIADT